MDDPRVTQLPWPFVSTPVADAGRDFGHVGTLPTLVAAAALLALWIVDRIGRRRVLRSAHRMALFALLAAGLTVAGYVGMASTWTLSHRRAPTPLLDGGVAAPPSSSVALRG